MTAALLRPRPTGDAGDAEQPGGAAEVDSAILRVSGGVGYVPRWSRPRRSRPCLSRPCRVPYHSFAHYSAPLPIPSRSSSPTASYRSFHRPWSYLRPSFRENEERGGDAVRMVGFRLTRELRAAHFWRRKNPGSIEGDK